MSQEKTALVTIGIPCFNGARWLEGAIQSALDQTWAEREVIVVDDGSTDGSREIAAGFGDRITLIDSAHRGATHARNLAMEAGRGEWIQFLDADDALQPQKIARQLEESEGGRDADILYSPVMMETTTGGTHTRRQLPIDTNQDLYIQWLAWQLPQTGGCLWRRGALEELGGWKEDQPCCQEHELYLRALKAGLRFRFTPSAGAIYRVWSEETLCRKDGGLVIRVKTGLIDDLAEWMRGRGLWTEAHRLAAGQACFEMARTLAKENPEEAVAYERERRGRGLLHLSGPAAPGAYRLTYAALGFARAEKIARALR